MKSLLKFFLFLPVILAPVAIFGECHLDTSPAALAELQHNADSGQAAAQSELGCRYARGQGGFKRDYAAALKWFQKAADQGDAKGENGLAVCYTYGWSVVVNYEEGAKWYKKAAAQGYAPAENGLGICYAHGDGGLPQDYVEAVKWLKKAADKGYAIAENNLGWCYEQGHGVPKDFAQAVSWYRNAAEQGIADAQYHLAICYEEGHGIAADSIEAYAWYELALDQNRSGAIDRQNALLEHMSGVQLKKAEQRIKELRDALKEPEDILL